MIGVMQSTALHERMKAMVGKTTFRALGQVTNHNPETVRRYMSGQAPSVEFLSALVSAYSVNADWLLTGRGPMDRSEARSATLANADPNELMAAIACRMEDMCDRLDRIEVFTQTMETRLRVSDVDGGSPGSASPVSEIRIRAGMEPHSDEKGLTSHDREGEQDAKQGADDPVAGRAGEIADTLPRRPRPDAGGAAPPGGA